jgi:hypothetical protein
MMENPFTIFWTYSERAWRLGTYISGSLLYVLFKKDLQIWDEAAYPDDYEGNICYMLELRTSRCYLNLVSILCKDTQEHSRKSKRGVLTTMTTIHAHYTNLLYMHW